MIKLNQHGGNGVNDDQVLALTREITEIGTTQKQMMELLRDMRQETQSLRQELSNNYVTKAMHDATVTAFNREIELLQQANTDRKEKPYKVWMAVVGIICALIGAVPGTIALLTGR